MVSEISGTGLSHSVASQVGTAVASRSFGSVASDEAGGVQPEVARDRQASAATPVAGAYAQLRARQDTLNKAASVVREVGDKVEQAVKLLDQVGNNMGQIVKMYPPYPIDSPQRISLLNEISGLRKQVEALTFPPTGTVDAVGRLLGGPSDTSGKEGDAVDKSDAASDVKDQLWDQATLDPLKASDADVSKALGQVKAMKSSLEELQAGMWKDVVSFVKTLESPEAQNMAAGVREQLADPGLGGRGIGSNARQLEQAAESN